jgi:Lysyl oxidase
MAICCAGALGAAAFGIASPARAAVDPNPCLTVFEKGLRCPDIVMDRPWGMYLDKATSPGRSLLRAGNAIESIGKGPVELHGVRYNRVYMHARQRIYKRGRGWVTVRTGAKLRLKFAHLSRYWWKFFNAASFELWRLDGEGNRTRKVRTGPKVSYCLRDLAHTRPWLARTPLLPHYPACSNNVTLRRDTLGTSVGWADVYPPDYPEQWIDVTGLRGCFAYVHIADPNNRIFESNENNNVAQVIVRLPFNAANRRAGCKGADRGRSMGQSEYY